MPLSGRLLPARPDRKHRRMLDHNAPQGTIVGSMIYTCFEMVRDCRADRPEGWRYFATNYVPLIRRLLAHYADASDSLLERVVLELRTPESSLFASLDPSPERPFVA